MKRPPRSFVVEVRRQRRPPNEVPASWAEEALKSVETGLADARPAAAPAPPPAAPVAPAKPTGRILPSLIEIAPPPPALAEAPAKAKRPAGRPRRAKPAAPTPIPDRVRRVEPAAAPPPAAPEPATAGPPSGDPARHRRILARYVFGGALKPGERWKRRLRGEDR